MQKISASFSRFLPVLTALAIVLVLSSVSAFAQTAPPAYDPGALATAAKADMLEAVGGVAPIVFGLLAIMLGIGYAWRRIKQGAKTS